MCERARVYVCAWAGTSVYVLYWGVMVYTGCLQGMRKVQFSCAYIVLTSSLQKCTIYILFFYLSTIQKEFKVTAPRKVFLRW